MKNYSKILCVVLALIVALSAASCSLTKQYAYKEDDVELPIGVYIYYLNRAYTQAESLAQNTDAYDSQTGRYNGKKSFLKVEITDDDGETAVAEDWIKEQAEKNTKHAVAIMTKFNELGCTIDEASVENTKSNFKSLWEKSETDQETAEGFLTYYGGTKKTFESIGISYESVFLAEYTLSLMENEVFNAEYAVDGPSAVSDEDLTAFMKDNYISYQTLYVDLYTTVSDEVDGSSETTDTTLPFSDEEIASYKDEFDSYASELSKGGSMADIEAAYMEKHSLDASPLDSRVVFKDDLSATTTYSEIKDALDQLEEGQALTVEIAEDETATKLYLVYREPIENQYEAYTGDTDKRSEILQKMRSDDFEDLLDDLADEVTLNKACKGYTAAKLEKKKSKK